MSSAFVSGKFLSSNPKSSIEILSRFSGVRFSNKFLPKPSLFSSVSATGSEFSVEFSGSTVSEISSGSTLFVNSVASLSPVSSRFKSISSSDTTSSIKSDVSSSSTSACGTLSNDIVSVALRFSSLISLSFS